MTELKNCPFCGDNHATTTYTRDGRLVVCTSCGAKSGNYYHGPKDLPSADERAIAAWNRRASQAAPTPHYGWIFLNPDTGIEWSEQHPIESGEVVDAENVRPATLTELKAQMVSAWSDLMDREAADDATPAPSDGLREAIEAERERIAVALETEADLLPCAEDAAVTRSNAALIRADFSYEDADRAEVERCEPGHYGEMDRHPEGDWVRFTDYQALRKRAEAAEERADNADVALRLLAREIVIAARRAAPTEDRS